MATINDRNTVKKLIQFDGFDPDYPDDPRVVKVVQYKNQFDGRTAYGLVYEGEDYNRYENSHAVRYPVVIWEAAR